MIDKLISKHLNESGVKTQKINEDSRKRYFWGYLPNYEREIEDEDIGGRDDELLVELEGNEKLSFGDDLEIIEVIFGRDLHEDNLPFHKIIPDLNKGENGEFFTDSEKKMKELMGKYINEEIKRWAVLKKWVGDLKG